MNEKQIRELAVDGLFHEEPISGTLEETHISWVIIGKKFAFKIKKPVKLSFLDFSTLRKRKRFCQKELALNSQFSSIYLSVVPVRRTGNCWIIGDGIGKIVDYAVMMKRLNPEKRMDKLLMKNKIPDSCMAVLAKDLARFHMNARVSKFPFNLADATLTFNDILRIKQFVNNNLGEKYAGIIDKSVAWSNKMLACLKPRMNERIRLGFKKDVHGDLHTGNIFAYKRPVIFDCIEFNDSYRQIDILSEIAFLYMDLEAFDRKDLAETFINNYKTIFNCFPEQQDYTVFNYYKCLRANIRAKVHAINYQQGPGTETLRQHQKILKTYLDLIEAYIVL